MPAYVLVLGGTTKRRNVYPSIRLSVSVTGITHRREHGAFVPMQHRPRAVPHLFESIVRLALQPLCRVVTVVTGKSPLQKKSTARSGEKRGISLRTMR
jgi:hypothetical protein